MESARLAVFEHHGRKIASGLFWQPLERPRGYMKEARQIGEQFQMDIVTVRHTETVIQAGFVSKRLGAIKGMYSFAAIMADRLGNKENGYSFLAAVQLDAQSYAMVAVSDNAIVPDSDRIGPIDEIRQCLQRFWSILNDPHIAVFAPSELSFGGNEVALDDILSKLEKKHQLRPLFLGLSKREVVTVTAVLVALAVGGSVAWTYWKQYQAQKEREAAAARARAEKIAHDTGRPADVSVLKHPWATMPAWRHFVAICEPAINAAPLAVGGWIFSSAKCSVSGLSLTYAHDKKTTATINDFTRAATDLWPGQAIGYDTDDTATVRRPLSFLAGGDDALVPVLVLRNNVVSHFQRQLVDPRIRILKVNAPALPGQAPKEPVADWTTYIFEPQSVNAPSVLLEGLPDSGVRMTEIGISLKGTDLTWHANGELYGK